MKLALIRRRYTDFGGAERYVNQLAARLVDLDHEVHVLAREWRPRQNTGLKFDRVSGGGGPSFVGLITFARAAGRLVEAGGYDLVHSFERTFSQDIFRAGDGCHREWLLRRTAAQGPTRGWLDRLSPRHRAFLYLEARLYADPRLKFILVNSKQGGEEIARHYGVPKEKIRVVYNGLDRGRFHPGLAGEHRRTAREELGLAPDEPTALFVGSGFARKGLAPVIRALTESRVTLLAAGRDRLGPYQALARRLGVERRVLFLGPRLDVERLLGAADLFVLPSLYEPFSNACLEAMAVGLPVVTTAGTGAAEIITEGRNGYVVSQPPDPMELAEKMNRALGIDRAALINFNREILTPFDWDRNLAETLAVYDAVRAGAG